MKTSIASRISIMGMAACMVWTLVGGTAATAAPASGSAKSSSRELPPPSAEPFVPLLDAGFHEMYMLNFSGARSQFLSYETQQPGDPLGKAAEAASYLYEQFNEKGIFTSAFFLDDDQLLGGVNGKPSDNRNDNFLAANRSARAMAATCVQSQPRNTQCLLALTLTDGMESDYEALIQKKQLAGLNLMRRAESEANALLAIDPTAQDAYVALGMSNYVIGCLPAYKRALLWFGHIHGDRDGGMAQMQIAAEHGHYLHPLAKIFLAFACEREHHMDRARALLTELTVEFPTNALYARELALAQGNPTARK